jgi:hypothetical protein
METGNRVELEEQRIAPSEEKIEKYDRDELTEKDKQLIKEIKNDDNGVIIDKNKYPMTRDADVSGFSQTRQVNIVSDNGEVTFITAWASPEKFFLVFAMFMISPFAIVYTIGIIEYTLWEIKWRYKDLAEIKD